MGGDAEGRWGSQRGSGGGQRRGVDTERRDGGSAVPGSSKAGPAAFPPARAGSLPPAGETRGGRGAGEPLPTGCLRPALSCSILPLPAACSPAPLGTAAFCPGFLLLFFLTCALEDGAEPGEGKRRAQRSWKGTSPASLGGVQGRKEGQGAASTGMPRYVTRARGGGDEARQRRAPGRLSAQVAGPSPPAEGWPGPGARPQHRLPVLLHPLDGFILVELLLEFVFLQSQH